MQLFLLLCPQYSQRGGAILGLLPRQLLGLKLVDQLAYFCVSR